ncbi:MAG TPA: iron-sulfur cluster assembly scaffold protein [Gammaproteobacteria bacterium]|jgi:NifU-like protein involved in Fe-S cluster formation
MDYSSEVAQRFRSSQRAGALAGETGSIVCGEAEDRSLNVWVRFCVRAHGGRLQKVQYEVFGCPHTIAAAAAAAEWLEGRDAGALNAWDAHVTARALEVPTEKLGKLLRIEDALRACGRELKKTEFGDGSTNGSIVDAKRSR